MAYLTLSDLGLGQESGGMTRAEYDRMLALEARGIPHEQAKLMVREGTDLLASKAGAAAGLVRALGGEAEKLLAPPPPPPQKKLPAWVVVGFGAAVGLGAIWWWTSRRSPEPVDMGRPPLPTDDLGDAPTGVLDLARDEEGDASTGIYGTR